MDKDFKDQILKMLTELDSHYDVLDNRFYALEAVMGGIRKDIIAIQAQVVALCERMSVGETKEEATGDDIVSIRQEAKEQTQHVWNGIRESQIHSRVDTGKMQDDLEKLLDLKINNSSDKIKLWIYVQAIALLILIVSQAARWFVR